MIDSNNQKQKRIMTQLKYIAVFTAGYLLGIAAIVTDLLIDGVSL